MKRFKLKSLKYAYTKHGIADIRIANKKEEYFLDEQLTIPLVFCSGEKNVDYWRKESNISMLELNRVFGKSESIEHYNKKMEIANNKTFIDNNLGLVFKADYAKTEYYLKDINKIVDIAFFDSSDNILLCIEVFHTNRKTSEDIDKFNQLDIIVYEYDIQKGGCYPISAGNISTEESESIKDRVRKGRIYVQRIRKEIMLLERKIIFYKKGIKRADNKRKKKWRSYYKTIDTVEFLSSALDPIQEQRREILLLEQGIREVRESIKGTEKKKPTIGGDIFKSECINLEGEIKIVQGDISKEEREELSIREEINCNA